MRYLNLPCLINFVTSGWVGNVSIVVLYRLHCFAKWRTQIYQAARARFYIRKSLYIFSSIIIIRPRAILMNSSGISI